MATKKTTKKEPTIQEQIQKAEEEIAELAIKKVAGLKALQDAKQSLLNAEANLIFYNARTENLSHDISSLKESLADQNLSPVELQKKNDLKRIQSMKRHEDWLKAEDAREASYKSMGSRI